MGKGTFSKKLWRVSCFFCTMRRCWEDDPKTSDPSVWSSFRAVRGMGWFEWQPVSNVFWNIDWEILLQINMKGGIVCVSGGMDQWVRARGALPDDEFDPQDQCDTRRSWVSNLQISKNHNYFDLAQVLQSFEREKSQNLVCRLAYSFCTSANNFAIRSVICTRDPDILKGITFT